MKVVLQFGQGTLLKHERPSWQTVITAPFVRAGHAIVNAVHRKENPPGHVLTEEENAAQIAAWVGEREKRPMTDTEIVYRNAMQQVFDGIKDNNLILQRRGFAAILENADCLPEEMRIGALAFGAVRSSRLPDLEELFITAWSQAVDAETLYGQYHAISNALGQNGWGNSERSSNFGRMIETKKQEFDILQSAPPASTSKPNRLTGFFSGLLNLNVT